MNIWVRLSLYICSFYKINHSQFLTVQWLYFDRRVRCKLAVQTSLSQIPSPGIIRYVKPKVTEYKFRVTWIAELLMFSVTFLSPPRECLYGKYPEIVHDLFLRVRSHCLETALVYLPISRWLHSNDSTRYNMLRYFALEN